MKRGRIIPLATYETAGELHRGPGDTQIEVEYDLWVSGRDDAGGRIRIGDDPLPAARFMGNGAAVFSGNPIYVLETASNHRVHIFFTSSDGHFCCQVADEATEALAGVE